MPYKLMYSLLCRHHLSL